MTEELLAAYNAITAKTGFGLHSAHTLIAAGATWPLLHKLTDAGLIRVHRVWMESEKNPHSITYRLFF